MNQRKSTALDEMIRLFDDGHSELALMDAARRELQVKTELCDIIMELQATTRPGRVCEIIGVA